MRQLAATLLLLLGAQALAQRERDHGQARSALVGLEERISEIRLTLNQLADQERWVNRLEHLRERAKE